MTGSIKVLVVEDHLITRLGLTMFLNQSPDITVAGEAADGLAALQVVETAAPDVVLMDIGLPEIDGVECLRRIKAKNVNTRVVMRSSHHEISAILGALGAGADGFSSKDSSDELLVLAIRCVAGGGAWIDPCIAQEILAVYGPGGPNRSLRTSTVSDEMLPAEVDLLERIASANFLEAGDLSSIDPAVNLGALMLKYGNLHQ